MAPDELRSCQLSQTPVPPALALRTLLPALRSLPWLAMGRPGTRPQRAPGLSLQKGPQPVRKSSGCRASREADPENASELAKVCAPAGSGGALLI